MFLNDWAMACRHLSGGRSAGHAGSDQGQAALRTPDGVTDGLPVHAVIAA